MIWCAIGLFCLYNFDALFLATNAPGRSALNRVERRMTPLSDNVAGVILPHDTFGSHIDSKGDTIDRDLEIKNFAYAGKVLGDIWSHTIINGFPTVSAFVDSEVNIDVIKKDEDWISKHVRQRGYITVP